MSDTPIVLWQMPPVWGLPNPSPFCMKVETWLRMAELPYVAKPIEGPPKSASGKIPYIDRPDGFLSDSTAIIETLTRERNVTLDRELRPEEHTLAVLMQRTLEEDLYFIILHERWVEPSGWSRVRADYFAPFPWILRTFVAPMVRRKTIATARGQGVSRLTAEQRLEKGKQDLDAVLAVLGGKDYFFGKPTSFDATAYAFLANLIWNPLEGELLEYARKQPELVAYCERMKERYWKDWPAKT